ncbi:MAG: hypothetical protein KBC48_02240 [Candidatus Pacebacteria bacterium]|nr:hypothetical protein [Candidatus Paceibacterota bacterium]
MEIKVIVLVYLVLAGFGAGQRRTYLTRKRYWDFGDDSKIWLGWVFYYGKVFSLLVFSIAVAIGIHTKYTTGIWPLLMERTMTWPAFAFCLSYFIGYLGWDYHWETKFKKKYPEPEPTLTESRVEVG